MSGTTAYERPSAARGEAIAAEEEGVVVVEQAGEGGLVAEEEQAWRMPIEEFTSKMKSEEELKLLKWTQKAFYKHQNEVVLQMMDAQRQAKKVERGRRAMDMSTDSLLADEEEEEEAAKKARREKLLRDIAIYGSLAANILLLVLKIVAAAMSGSLSVLASALDSFLDLLSGMIIFMTEYIRDRASPENYPAGKTRFEPVGIVIFSSCMFTATFQLLLSSVQTLILQDMELEMSLLAMLVLLATIAIKVVLWLFCREAGDSETVKALATDHRNDVISNIFGTVTALLGFYVRWWIDPIGAVCISLYLMAVWASTAFGQLSTLTGRVASPEVHQALTFVARNHHPKILAIDTVKAYHLGYNYTCEVDIVLPPEMPLHEAHDIGEALQYKLEGLELVERAFVHLDFETSHKPEHGFA